MKYSKLLFIGLINALGVAIYATLISFVLQNGEKIFGKMNNFLGPMALLMIFVLSAAVTGALVLGRPIILYLENKKAEAIRLFLYTLAWILIITLIVLIVQIIR